MERKQKLVLVLMGSASWDEKTKNGKVEKVSESAESRHLRPLLFTVVSTSDCVHEVF